MTQETREWYNMAAMDLGVAETVKKRMPYTMQDTHLLYLHLIRQRLIL